MQLASSQERAPLWTPGFFSINLIHLLMGMSVYALLPLWPMLMQQSDLHDKVECAAAIAVFAVGLYLPCGFCNYWLDTYKRTTVCQTSIIVYMVLLLLSIVEMPLCGMLCMRLLQGVSYGVFQVAMGSTIMIDVTDTTQRTRAAHVYYWFGRFALALGPAIGLWAVSTYSIYGFPWLVLAMVMPGLLLLWMLHVPFRMPLEPKLLSTDRFWMKHGVWLFVCLFLFSVSAGALLASMSGLLMYACVAVGFSLALLLHVICLGKADIRWGICIGIFALILAALIGVYFSNDVQKIIYSILLGLGVATITSRLLLSMIRVAQHCQRGTAQSTYMLGWESGLVVGYAAAYMLNGDNNKYSYLLSIGLLLTGGALYMFRVYAWYIKNKCR